MIGEFLSEALGRIFRPRKTPQAAANVNINFPYPPAHPEIPAPPDTGMDPRVIEYVDSVLAVVEGQIFGQSTSYFVFLRLLVMKNILSAADLQVLSQTLERARNDVIEDRFPMDEVNLPEHVIPVFRRVFAATLRNEKSMVDMVGGAPNDQQARE